MIEPGYLKIKDIAETANVSTRTVHRWIKSGELPAYHLSRSMVRIKVKDWEVFERIRQGGKRG